MDDEKQAKEWAQVMSGMRGARLAIYDDLLRLGAVEYNRMRVAVKSPAAAREAITWLAVHRFLKLEAGQWAARSIPAARDTYRAEGRDVEPIGAMPPDLCEVPAAGRQRDGGTERGREQASRPVVHAGQVQFFDMEGYRS